MSATDNGAATEFEHIDGPLTDNEATDVFLKRFLPPDADNGHQDKEDKKAPASAGEEKEATSNDGDEEAPAEKPEGSEEAEGEEGTEDRKYADDEGSYVKIKVGDEEHEVPVKDLKRLYGQEASLTKKSMEVAEHRKAVDDEMVKATAASAAMLERAKTRFQPYSQIDFLLAAKELSAEDYQALRNEAAAAYQDVQFLEKNLNDLAGQIKQKQNDDLITTARESLKVLSGPVEKGGIEGWDEKKYDEIRAFAITEGAPPEMINRLVDAWAIRLLHDAMLYKRGKSKVVTTKVNKTPTKVVKTTNTPKSGVSANADKADKAMDRLRKSGRSEDATEVFLARWGAAADQNE